MEKSITHEASMKISWLMFICCCLIVLRHSSGYDDYNVGTSQIEEVSIYIIDTIRFNGVFNMVMPMFFIVSGFLFYKSFDVCGYRNKIKSRLFSLMIPYVIWNSFWMTVMAIFEMIPTISSKIDSMEHFSFTIENIFRGIFLYKYNPSFWFVGQIIIFSICSPVIYLILKRKYLGLVIILLLAVNLCNIPLIREDGALWYLIGAYLAIHHFDLVNVPFKMKWHILSVICLIGCFWLYDYLPANSLLRTFFTCIQLILLWVGVDCFRVVSVKWWTKIHFFIYGLHQITQLCINKILIYVFVQSKFILINFFGGAFLTILFCIISAYFLKGKFPKLWLIINGRR